MKISIKGIIGFYLAMILLALFAIFGFIYFESIDFQKYIETETNVNHNTKRSIKKMADYVPSIPTKDTTMTTMLPFHINDNTTFCFEIETTSDYKYVLVKYDYEKFKYYLSKTPVMNRLTTLTDVNSFDVVNDRIYFDRLAGRQIKNFWITDKQSNELIDSQIPIKVILQRLSVLSHYQNSKTDNNKDIRDLTTNMLEDAQILATMSMISYSEQVMGITHFQDSNQETHYFHAELGIKPFYGGEIVKVKGINPVGVNTKLPPPNQLRISAGPLLVYAWKYQNVFVIAFRGTHFRDNWSINFKCKAKQIKFKPFDSRSDSNEINGDIHSGIYDVVHEYFQDFMKVFEAYNNEKRIIFTGHSLGSGLAQVMLLHLLDINNHGLLTPKVMHIIHGNSGVSLEFVGFGGPAIMDQGLTNTLKAALDNFNDRPDHKMIYRPDPNYSALLFKKINDPVSLTGVDGVNFLNNVLNWPIMSTVSEKYVISKMNEARIALGKAGLQDIIKYQHFGKVITVDSSTIYARNEWIDVQGHGEYFDAEILVIKKQGLKGWVY